MPPRAGFQLAISTGKGPDKGYRARVSCGIPLGNKRHGWTVAARARVTPEPRATFLGKQLPDTAPGVLREHDLAGDEIVHGVLQRFARITRAKSEFPLRFAGVAVPEVLAHLDTDLVNRLLPADAAHRARKQSPDADRHGSGRRQPEERRRDAADAREAAEKRGDGDVLGVQVVALARTATLR